MHRDKSVVSQSKYVPFGLRIPGKRMVRVKADFRRGAMAAEKADASRNSASGAKKLPFLTETDGLPRENAGAEARGIKKS